MKANQILSYNEALKSLNVKLAFEDDVLVSQLQLKAGQPVHVLKMIDSKSAAWIDGILIQPKILSRKGRKVEGWEIAIIIDAIDRNPYIVNAWFQPSEIQLVK